MRRKLIAGNWKMYKTTAEAVALVDEIKKGASGAPSDVLVAPPYTSLVAVVAAAKGSPVAVAAQNMHFEKEGAYTGEVSAAMLKDIGVGNVILGHSERRQYFAETDEGVAKKTKVALDNGLTPISCVGETARRARGRQTMEVVGRQVDAILNAVSADEAKKVVIAYEPVWAIGTGKVATPEQAQEVHAFIRSRIAAKHGQAGGRRPPHPLRRQRQARQRQGPDGAPGRRRRARRRRLAQGRLVPQARPLRQAVTTAGSDLGSRISNPRPRRAHASAGADLLQPVLPRASCFGIGSPRRARDARRPHLDPSPAIAYHSVSG